MSVNWKSNEEKVLNYLNKDLEDKFIKEEWKWSRFDYYNNSTKIELKSRSCSKDKYPTTIVGYNKIKWAEKEPDFKYIFYFLFSDGLYYWELCDNYKVGKGGIQRNKDYAFINKDDLILATNSLCSVN